MSDDDKYLKYQIRQVLVGSPMTLTTLSAGFDISPSRIGIVLEEMVDSGTLSKEDCKYRCN